MTAFARRRLVMLGAAVAAIALCSIGPGTAAAGPDPDAGPAATENTLDGFSFGYLPQQRGPLVSDFDYEWGEVSFRTRVWERGPDAEGNHHVDLRAAVLRGDRLTDPEALHDFLAEYLERDPQHWALQRYERGGYRGYTGPGRVFFLAR
ncbi:MAG TPA: hypothetical protein VHH34_17685, partial [Pseudonocardiaceae bacterium]|nr:hypothetical protein [Pseudonocardiaceae bacterium]